MKWKKKYALKSFVGVSELAEAAKAVLESSTIQQDRNKVAKFPNERTIRFYLTEGLLPLAASTEGTSSVFTYTHLLTLIVIKRLQSQGLPIRIIQRIIADRNNAELEKLLDEPVAVTTDLNQAQVARIRGEEVIPISDQDEIKEILEFSKESGKSTTIDVQTWEHFLIANGIELHISNKSDLDKKRKQKLVQNIQDFLHS